MPAVFPLTSAAVDDDELAQMMVESAFSASVRRGRTAAGAGAAVAVKPVETAQSKNTASVLKPLKQLKGF